MCHNIKQKSHLSLYHCWTGALMHDDVIKWKHFLCYWPFVWGIHWSPVNSPHKGQRCRALQFSLVCAWINGWDNNCETGDLRCHHARYDIIVVAEEVFVFIVLLFILLRAQWGYELKRMKLLDQDRRLVIISPYLTGEVDFPKWKLP